ncbi:MAG TPA: hypothetical protein PLK99_07420 [Burkholderiales bacterium]|nr:hypothetical protein [Burkholderiales bacterium]
MTYWPQRDEGQDHLLEADGFNSAVGWIALVCSCLWSLYALGGLLQVFDSTLLQRLASLAFIGLASATWVYTRRTRHRIREALRKPKSTEG